MAAICSAMHALTSGSDSSDVSRHGDWQFQMETTCKNNVNIALRKHERFQ
jgi:hypothetical protein